MKKLTAKEILEIVSANYTISDFAHGELLDPSSEIEVPKNVGEKEQKEKDDLYKNISEELGENATYRDEVNHPRWEEYSNMPSKYEIIEKYILDKLGLGEIIEVDQGGGMDEGSNWYSVKYFKDHDVYIQTNGYYQSHWGTEFEDGYGEEVFPKQKTITIFTNEKN